MHYCIDPSRSLGGKTWSTNKSSAKLYFQVEPDAAFLSWLTEVVKECEKYLRVQCGITHKVIPTYLLQQRKDGMEFKASIKAFRKDGGGKDDYKWTILKYVKLMDGKLVEIDREDEDFCLKNGSVILEVSVHCFSGKFPCVVARMSKKVFVCAYGREDDSEDESKDNSDSEDANDLSHLTAFSPSHTMAREKYMAALKSAKWHMNSVFMLEVTFLSTFFAWVYRIII
eukprot:g9782.t1